MKKITLCFVCFTFILISFAHGQYSTIREHKTITDAETGSQVITQKSDNIQTLNPSYFENGTKEVEINWQYTDPGSIGSEIQVSSATGQTFVSWWLNDERISLYGSSSTPEWEQFIETDWAFPIDMTEDGVWAVMGYDTAVQVYKNTSSDIFWEVIVDGIIYGTRINPEGTMAYIARNIGGDTYVDAYEIGESTPEWSTFFSGNGTVFTGSDDGSTLVLGQYSGVNKMWVLETGTGDVIFDAFYKNQSAPALSYDGSIILNGDYSGNVYVYAYDPDNSTYNQSWTYKVGGGGTSVWVLGMGVSGDGSTLAVGTLVFVSGGGYDGEIYLFNSWSPVPLWIFSNAGDEVPDIDFSYDGSLMAAAGWGPLDHSKPDFWIFRKESSEPIYSINTMGSFNSVDLSSDGTLCAVTGKAVHSREFGSGGLLYNVDSDPDGGLVSGTVNLENSSDYKDVKLTINELQDYFAYTISDGSYEVKYIPPGTYSVTAHKIGYYPVTIEDVEVLEGETTNLDFNLDETGNPPYGLFATKEAGMTIELNWKLDDPQDILGFKLYRKHIEGDLFPEEPIMTFTNAEFTYSDADIIPLREYYYAVTAIVEDGVESPYSNLATGSMSHGFVTGEASAYVGNPPVIDGTISPGEWDDAFKLDASDFLGKYDNTINAVGSVTMYYKTNADLSKLFVACINENDSVLEDHDEVAMYMDDNNDGSYPVPDDYSEGNYWAAYYSTGSVIKYRPIYNNGGTGEVIYLENPEIEVSIATGVVVYEFVLPLGEDEPWQINPNADNESGMFLFVLDDPSAFDGYWPCWNPEIFVPLDYGKISFGAEDTPPPAPEETSIWWVTNDEVTVILDWLQPDINDFDHFNIYSSEGGGSWVLLESTIGTQYIHMTGLDYQEYVVTTVDQAGQESEESEVMIYDITIGIDETQQHAITAVYPNPSSGQTTLSMAIQTPGYYTLSIINIKGQIVKTIYADHAKAGLTNFAWDGNNEEGKSLQKGIYFIHLSGEGATHTNKLIWLGN